MYLSTVTRGEWVLFAALPVTFLVTLDKSPFSARFPMAIISDVPSNVTAGSAGPYLAIEPIQGYGGVGRPQHAHGGGDHVREDGLVPPPPLLLLRARVRVRALRPPGRLHSQVSGQAWAPPCSEPPQPPLSTFCPTPRLETLLYPLRNAGRRPSGAPAPATKSKAPPFRPPQPSHSARKERRLLTHEVRSREACTSRDI